MAHGSASSCARRQRAGENVVAFVVCVCPPVVVEHAVGDGSVVEGGQEPTEIRIVKLEHGQLAGFEGGREGTAVCVACSKVKRKRMRRA